MKNYLKLATVAVALLMVTAIVVTFEACRKHTDNVIPQTQTSVKSIIPNDMENIDKYLSDFLSRMNECKGDETISVEDAMWHMQALANFEFGYANADMSDIRTDTIISRLETSNGSVRLSTLSDFYSKLHKDIISYYKSQELENKNFKFITCEIDKDNSGDGYLEIKTAMVLMSGWSGKNGDDRRDRESLYCFYDFEDEFEAMCFYFEYLTEDYYPFIGSGDVLTNFCNAHGPATCTLNPHDRIFYININEVVMDAVGSGHNLQDPRIFWCEKCSYNMVFSPDEIFRMADNYICIGLENEPDESDILFISVFDKIGFPDETERAPVPIYHKLQFEYGEPYITHVNPNLY